MPQKQMAGGKRKNLGREMLNGNPCIRRPNAELVFLEAATRFLCRAALLFPFHASSVVQVAAPQREAGERHTMDDVNKH